MEKAAASSFLTSEHGLLSPKFSKKLKEVALNESDTNSLVSEIKGEENEQEDGAHLFSQNSGTFRLIVTQASPKNSQSNMTPEKPSNHEDSFTESDISFGSSGEGEEEQGGLAYHYEIHRTGCPTTGNERPPF